ncbi:MAG: family metallopeptidase, partial [Verrucomicrobiaceae bacterium]|nr:family metallopeptidase [Verrucomicrobiaceae bacterium]
MNTLFNSAGSWLQAVAVLSWKGAAFALVTGLAVLVLRKRLSPAWRHGLWLLVLVRLAAPDLGTSSWSMSRWMLAVPGPAAAAAATATVVVDVPRMPVAVSSADQRAQGQQQAAAADLAAGLARLKEALVEPGALVDGSSTQAQRQSLAKAQAVGAAAVTAAPAVPWTVWRWLTLLWLSGSGLVLAAMAAVHLRMRGRVRRDSAAPPAQAVACLRQACALAGVRRMPALIVTDAVRAPALFGIVRPVILLPRGLADSCDAASLKLILLHELAHLQRRDLWAQVAASLVIALHWFNPVVWWAARRLRAEAEMAADARALRCTDAREAHRMGEVLLGFASHAATGWMVWFAAATVLGISENKRDLRRRIEALMDVARGRRPWWVMGLLAFVILSITGLTKAPAGEAARAGDTATAVTTTTTTTTTTTVAAPGTATSGTAVNAAPAAGTTTTVTGTVVDEAGKAVQGAMCFLRIGERQDMEVRKTLSDSQGRFRFEGVPVPMPLSLSAHHEDYLDATPTYTTFASEAPPQEQRIVLPKAASWITGTITHKTDGTPVKDADVYLGMQSTMPVLLFLRSAPRKVKTDAAGRYRAAAWAADKTEAMLLVDAPGTVLTANNFTLKDGENTVDQALETDAGLKGTVVNADGRPVQDAVVCISDGSFYHHFDGMLPMKSLEKPGYYTNGLTYWLGNAATDAKGAFAGRALDVPEGLGRWLVFRHPTGGFQHVRMSNWKAGGTVKLKRWNTIQGTLQDGDGKPIKGAKIDISDHVTERDDMDKMTYSLMNRSTATTDGQGRYRIDHVLPHAHDSLVSVNDVFHGSTRLNFDTGETQEFNIRMRAKEKPVPKEQLRKVTGRVVLPPGREVKNADYEIRVSARLEGDEKQEQMYPDAQGVFASQPLAPGSYRVQVRAQPKDMTKLWPALNGGATMRVKLEQDAAQQPLALGDLTLDETDFAFRTVTEELKKAKAPTLARKIQRINVPVTGGLEFATWAGSPGSGLSKETPMEAGGRITGRAVLGSQGFFMIRGTKADGSHWFSPPLSAQVDLDKAIETPVAFTPAVAVAGRMLDLPESYAGDGWMVAVVIVTAEVPPGTAVKGNIPSMAWNAWSPVAKDGSFRFATLPRGKLTLAGFAGGCITHDAANFSTFVPVGMLGAEALKDLKIASIPCVKKQVRLVGPDETPAAGATITIDTDSTANNPAFVHRGHDADPADAEAYQRYKKAVIPGHSVVADAEGYATLGNQAQGQTTCIVKWTDPHTQAVHQEKVEVINGLSLDAP